MTSDQPLHVQIAALLGCEPVGVNDVWFCGCKHEPGQDRPHGDRWGLVIRYDAVIAEAVKVKR